MSPFNIAVYIRYSIFRKCPETGWKIDMRTISDHEFVLITRGRGIVIIEGKQYTAKPGMLFYFYPGLLHSLESSSENPMSFFAHHFSFTSIEYANNQWKTANKEAALPLAYAMEIGNNFRLEELMKQLNEHWNKKEQGSELICNGLFMQLLHMVFQDSGTGFFNYASKKKLDEAISYIGKNLESKLSVSLIAKTVGLSPDYLTSLFKSYTGYTLTAYIGRCRIDAAKTMLMEENMKVKEVAARLGFCDEFHFSKVFKRLEGVSPIKFLR